jgi:hypothetical protein
VGRGPGTGAMRMCLRPGVDRRRQRWRLRRGRRSWRRRGGGRVRGGGRGGGGGGCRCGPGSCEAEACYSGWVWLEDACGICWGSGRGPLPARRSAPRLCCVLQLCRLCGQDFFRAPPRGLGWISFFVISVPTMHIHIFRLRASLQPRDSRALGNPIIRPMKSARLCRFGLG